METLVKVISVSAATVALFIALVVLGPVIGIVAGWACTLVGLEGIIRSGMAGIGLPFAADTPLWVIGGALGFFGGFFKASTSVSKS